MVEQMLDEAQATPHVDIVSAALRLFLSIPIAVLKTKYQTSTKARANKLWKAYWHYLLDSDSKGNFSYIKVILVDNNEGFVVPAVASCQAELHEEFTMAISALEDSKDNFKCITSLVPEGSEEHETLLMINTQIKAAYRVTKLANLAMGTADVAGTMESLGIMLRPCQQLLAPRKIKKNILNSKSVPIVGGGGDSESDDNLQTQDPQGGEFQNGY